jgi:hypothetical protein
VDGGVGRPAPHGEVVSAHDHRPPADPATAEQEVGRDEADQLVVVAVGGPAGEGADLVKAVRVEQASMRWRTVNRPASCWRLTFSGPPISRASASRRRTSATSASHVSPVASPIAAERTGGV